MKYSIVIPLKDEESNIEDLIAEVEPVMENLGEPWELIAVDDGSTDRTKEILGRLQIKKTYLHPLYFDRNYGQSSAFDAGFKAARGEFVITLDGDRQNDPADIPSLVALMDRCDLVCGQRINRRDSWVKKITSSLANTIRGRVCRDGMKDTGCSLKVYRTKALRQIKLYNGLHRFLPALFLIEGFRVEQVPVNHREREKGTSKYNFFNRSFNTITDMWAVWWMRRRQLRYALQEKGDSHP